MLFHSIAGHSPKHEHFKQPGTREASINVSVETNKPGVFLLATNPSCKDIQTGFRSWQYLKAPHKSAEGGFFWPRSWRPSAGQLFRNVNNTIISMTYIFKAVFLVQFKILNPKKALLKANQNIKQPLHVACYMIANPVWKQSVLPLLNLPHRSGNQNSKIRQKKKCIQVESNIQNQLELDKHTKKQVTSKAS